MDETTNSQEGQSEDRLSFMAKLSAIFTNPRKVFENLKLYPDWLMPALLLIVIAIVSGYFVKDIAIQAQRDRIINSDQIPEEQKDLILQSMDQQTGSPLQMVSVILGPAVYVFLAFALAAALFLFSGNTILGGSANYKQMLAVYSWGSLIGIPEAIIKIPLVAAKNSIHVYTSLAILFDPAESGTALFKIADAVNIFSIWRIALWSLGFGIVYNFTQGKSYIVVLFWYAVWIAVAIAFGSLTRGFLG